MDRDELVNKRVAQIARDHGCTVDQVNAALDRHPIELDRDQFLRRTLALELIELDALQQAFRAKALEDRDVGSGLLLLKVAERRATLLGMNAPQGHAVQIIQHEPAEARRHAGLEASRLTRSRLGHCRSRRGAGPARLREQRLELEELPIGRFRRTPRLVSAHIWLTR